MCPGGLATEVGHRQVVALALPWSGMCSIAHRDESNVILSPGGRRNNVETSAPSGT